MTELRDVSGAFAYGDSLLVGERVRLRGVREDELATLARWEMDAGRSATLMNQVAPPSEAAAKELIAKWSANQDDTIGFAIETLDDPAVLVGHVSIFSIRAKDRHAALGIALGREHIGRGYGTDAMRAIVGYGFRELGLHRIELTVAPFNQAGIRAYEKAGFTEEGPAAGEGAARRALVRRGADGHPGPRVGGPAGPGRGRKCGRIRGMTELVDASSAFGYGDSILVGDRVGLRGVLDDDLATLARWDMDPGRLTTLADRVAPQSEAAARERIAQRCANDGDSLGFAIVKLDGTTELIGMISLAGMRPKSRCATLGIALGRDFLGRGYGSDAMRVIVDYGFRELGLHRIQLGVAPFNQGGIRAYEKAGFSEEGRLRESVLHDGRWYDEILMSVIDREWAARRA